MTGVIQIPPRRWGDEDERPEVVPVVVVSSRDNAPAPKVPAVQRLAVLAERNGWTARLTYAEATLDDQHYLNGRLKKPAHSLATVALRLARGNERGFAVWQREDAGSWRFSHAYVGPERHGARSIVDRIAQGGTQ